MVLDRRRFLTTLAATLVVGGCAAEDDVGAPRSGTASGNADERPRAAAGEAVLLGSVVTRWSQDPFSLGSYSFLAAGATSGDRVALRSDVGERLFFAGEATAVEFPSTVHGALLEGAAAAERIDEVSTGDEHIVVIGAGAAGLAAARWLADEDYSVQVVEGRDRIGGRVHTDLSLGVPVDLGAAWIHGVNHNPLTELADNAAAGRVATDPDKFVGYDVDGTELDEDDLAAVEARLEALSESDATTVAEALADDVDGLDPAERRLWAYATTSTIEHEFGADIGDLDPATFDEGDALDGGDVTFTTGMLTALEPLAAGLDIETGRTVQRIDIDSTEVRITLVDGAVVRADRVLVTVPLGVLKAGSIEFRPPLPTEKQAAIDRLGMGLLNKVVLRFDQVFWDEDADLIGYASDPSGRFIEWLNLTKVVGEPVLVGFNAASPAAELETWSDAELVDLALTTLRTIYDT